MTTMTLPGPVPIAILLRTFEPGGTERQMVELVRRLDPSRWQVHVACFAAHGAWRTRAEERAASIVEFPVRSFKGAGALTQLRAFGRWCRARRIALVQTTGMPTNLFGLPAAFAAGVPVRIGARREINANRTAPAIAAQRAAYACATAVVANSNAAAARLRREWLPAHRIRVIANGLETDAFGEPPRRPPRTVVVVANLRAEKRHDVLVDAAPRILAAFPDARFHLVGDGPERGRLEALIGARGVSHAFEMTGHEPDVPARLARSDIFVLPSESEGFPNAVLEAMAAGLPVVASDLPAIREITADVRLVAPRDPDALARALCDVMADESGARRMAARARDAVRHRYSFERMVASFEQLYVSELTRRTSLGLPRLSRCSVEP